MGVEGVGEMPKPETRNLSPDTRSILIINPISGQGWARAAKDRIVTRLGEIGPLEVVETRAAGDAALTAAKAVEQGINRVIAAGGDGTINEVINGLAGADVELGIMPLGTANVLARELDIPLENVEGACDVIAAGNVRQMDLAKAGERYFSLMAGIGFDAAVVDRVDRDLKDLLGPAAYGVATLSELVYHKGKRFKLTMDGIPYETDASLVVVANVSSYAMNIKVATHAAYDDGLLDICVFESGDAQRATLLSQALRLIFTGWHDGDQTVRCFRAADVTVESEPEALVQVDGDVVGQTPIEIRVAPGALRVLAP
jgi:diacylglycerol kinase (ATP)